MGRLSKQVHIVAKRIGGPTSIRRSGYDIQIIFKYERPFVSIYGDMRTHERDLIVKCSPIGSVESIELREGTNLTNYTSLFKLIKIGENAANYGWRRVPGKGMSYQFYKKLVEGLTSLCSV